MNFDDPTDISNVSIDGIAERMVLSRAAESVGKQRGGAAKAPAAPAQPKPPPPPPKASRAEIVAEKEVNEFEQRQSLLDKIGKRDDDRDHRCDRAHGEQRPAEPS